MTPSATPENYTTLTDVTHKLQKTFAPDFRTRTLAAVRKSAQPTVRFLRPALIEGKQEAIYLVSCEEQAFDWAGFGSEKWRFLQESTVLGAFALRFGIPVFCDL